LTVPNDPYFGEFTVSRGENSSGSIYLTADGEVPDVEIWEGGLDYGVTLDVNILKVTYNRVGTTFFIKNIERTNGYVAENAITGSKIAANAVDNTKIPDGELGLEKLNSSGAASGQVPYWDGEQYLAKSLTKSDIGGLSATQIPFGDTSGVMTSSADLIFYDNGNGTLVSNGDLSLGNNTRASIQTSETAATSDIGDAFQNGNGNMIRVDDINNTAFYSNASLEGKFGINTSNPSEALDVVGNLKVSGVLKLRSSSGTSGQVLTSNGESSPTWQTPSGGGTWGSITGTLSSQTDLQTVLNAKQATITTSSIALDKLTTISTSTFLGRATAGTGNVENLTATQATSLLNTFTSSLKGLVPASGGGTTNFLRADGTWAAPSGGGGGTTLPDQTGNTGKFLGSDGTNLYWSNATIPGAVIATGTLAAGAVVWYNNTNSRWEVYVPQNFASQGAVTGVSVGQIYTVTDGSGYRAMFIKN
jgi:hypothetical protein